MLVYFLSSILGLGADLLRVEVSAGSRWINRLVSHPVHNLFSQIYV
jgi:hypothetical protein